MDSCPRSSSCTSGLPTGHLRRRSHTRRRWRPSPRGAEFGEDGYSAELTSRGAELGAESVERAKKTWLESDGDYWSVFLIRHGNAPVFTGCPRPASALTPCEPVETATAGRLRCRYRAALHQCIRRGRRGPDTLITRPRASPRREPLPLRPEQNRPWVHPLRCRHD